MLYVTQFLICLWLICLTVLCNAVDYAFRPYDSSSWIWFHVTFQKHLKRNTDQISIILREEDKFSKEIFENDNYGNELTKGIIKYLNNHGTDLIWKCSEVQKVLDWLKCISELNHWMWKCIDERKLFPLILMRIYSFPIGVTPQTFGFWASNKIIITLKDQILRFHRYLTSIISHNVTFVGIQLLLYEVLRHWVGPLTTQQSKLNFK